MSVKERGYMKGAPGEAPEAKPSAWMARVNEFGERHATAIIAASTVLTILTVILFATYFYNRSQNEKAELELGEARTVDKLKELRDKFGSTPAGSRILYRLANQYYEEGKLEEARKEYTDFLTRYPADPLKDRVATALRSLEKNLAFLREDRDRRMKESRLQTHPRTLPEAKDPRLQWGPVLQPRPTVELEVATGRVTLELYEDEAPKAVAAFLKLVDEKHYDGIKLDMVNTDERLATVPKADKPVDPVPFEKMIHPAEANALLLVRKEGADQNLGGQFQVLLKSLPDLKDVTVFGTVREGAPLLRALRKDDIIKTAKVATRRGADQPLTPTPKPR